MADLKELLGEDYKDEMTLEEVNSLLANRTLVDSSTLPKSVGKDQFDKVASELSKTKKELTALKENSLSDDEKLKAALENAEKSRIEYASKSNRLEVEKLFLTNNLKAEDYAEVINGIVSDDIEKTTALANAIVNSIKAEKEAIEKSVKADFINQTPKPPHTPTNAPSVDYDKKIAEAQQRGDLQTAAYLLRKKQEEI